MIQFTKYHGLGNDFILLDHRDRQELLLTPQQAIQWCDRNFGIGADGVIFLLQDSPKTYRMRILNSDGSEPEMCGNGIRCLAKFMEDLGIPTDSGSYEIYTGAGTIVPTITADGFVTVDMGEPRLAAAEIPTTLEMPDQKVVNVPLIVAGKPWQVSCVSMGNPHCITFVDDVSTIVLEEIGPQFEHHPAFPQRTNTEFIQVIGRDRLKMRVWERGAGATLACGTGACAAVVAAVLNQVADPCCRVELPGGDLEIHWDRNTNHVLMTGPAQRVFSGEVNSALLF